MEFLSTRSDAASANVIHKEWKQQQQNKKKRNRNKQRISQYAAAYVSPLPGQGTN